MTTSSRPGGGEATQPSPKALPTFGLIRIEEPDPGELTACLGQNDTEELDDLTPADLRDLAAACIAAAEWLEAHR